jgi:hypothetical protein
MKFMRLIIGEVGKRDKLTGGTLAARESHYQVPEFSGVHELILNLNHFPGPTNRDAALRRFFEKHLDLNISQTTTRGI